MVVKQYVVTLIVALVFSGCMGAGPQSNEAMSAKKLENQSDMELLDSEEMYEEETAGKELFFADTQGKFFYSGISSAKTDIGYRVELLLSDLFFSSKNKLPKISRKKKLNIALEISKTSDQKNKVIQAAQNYVLSKKRYALANSDVATLKVLKKVLRTENDSIYKSGKKVKSKNASDIILFVSAKERNKKLSLKAKIISKNGTILGQATSNLDLSKNTQKDWVEVKVPREDGQPQLFEVMRKAVTQEVYSGIGGNRSVVNVTFIAANRYCKQKLQAELITPYVFEHARRSLAIERPNGANTEVISPYDEEDDEIYFQDGDELEGPDSSIVSFQWNGEKYFSVSNLFKSMDATFRCMKVK